MMMLMMFIIITTTTTATTTTTTTTIARVSVYNTLPDKMLRYKNSIFVVL